MLELIHKIDNDILEFIQIRISSKRLDCLMPFITHLGTGGILWIAVAFAFLTSELHQINGILLINALLLCVLIGNIILKPLFARNRPCDINSTIRLLIPKPRDYSFPSGHTMSSFAAATTIFYINYRMGIIALFIALLIAFSRLYLYVHYPTDILAGLILGILVSILAIWLQDYIMIVLESKM